MKEEQKKHFGKPRKNAGKRGANKGIEIVRQTRQKILKPDRWNRMRQMILS